MLQTQDTRETGQRCVSDLEGEGGDCVCVALQYRACSLFGDRAAEQLSEWSLTHAAAWITPLGPCPSMCCVATPPPKRPAKCDSESVQIRFREIDRQLEQSLDGLSPFINIIIKISYSYSYSISAARGLESSERCRHLLTLKTMNSSSKQSCSHTCPRWRSTWFLRITLSSVQVNSIIRCKICGLLTRLYI